MSLSTGWSLGNFTRVTMFKIENISAAMRQRKGLGKILGNTGWLLAERVILLAIGLLVGVFVARYLGPEKFGLLSYAASVISFLSTFVYLGLSGLVVRDLVRCPEDKDILLGTTFFLKVIGGGLAFLIVVTTALLTIEIGGEEFWIMLIVGLSLLVRPFETIDFWFQSQVQSKYSVMGKSVAAILAAGLRLLLVFLGASVIAFAVATSLQGLLAAILLVWLFHRQGSSILRWRFQALKAWALLTKSWIIVISGFLALVNLKVDQIMLRWMAGAAEVGIYSVAVRFSEIWYFIPSAIVMSAYPILIGHRKVHSGLYDKRLQQMFDALFAIALLVALIVTFAAGPLIPWLYGEAFAGSAGILVIHVWAGIFMFMRALFSKWVLIEDALYFSLFSHGVGAVINVIMNLGLIPAYGGRGAAVATLFSYAASSYFILFFCAKTRPLAVKMSRAFILPLRMIVSRGKPWAYCQEN